MKVKVRKNGSITLTAEKPGELTKWFREVAEAAEKSIEDKKSKSSKKEAE